MSRLETVATGSNLASAQNNYNYQNVYTTQQCLRILGVRQNATFNEIHASYKSLVSDIKPGVNANHSRVEPANQLLAEVELAYQTLNLYYQSETKVS